MTPPSLWRPRATVIITQKDHPRPPYLLTTAQPGGEAVIHLVYWALYVHAVSSFKYESLKTDSKTQTFRNVEKCFRGFYRSGNVHCMTSPVAKPGQWPKSLGSGTQHFKAVTICPLTAPSLPFTWDTWSHRQMRPRITLLGLKGRAGWDSGWQTC